jgi:serine/threonine protein kinase
MAKSPLANDSDAARADRRTRIASGPAPMPMPAPPPLGKPAVPPAVVAKALGATGDEPVPPPLTGKTKLPDTPVPDPSLPSYQETVIGPAPAPPVPAPPKAATPTPAYDDTVVGPAPAPARPRAKTAPSFAPDDEMDAFMAEGFFDGDQDPPHDSRADATLPAPSRGTPPGPTRDTVPGPLPVPPPHSGPLPLRDGVSGPIPVPPKPSGPAPKATGRSDTLPNAELRVGPGGATLPPTRQGLATAETLDFSPATEPDVADVVEPPRRPTGVMPSRQTASQGVEPLAASAEVPKLRLVPGKVIPGTRYQIRRWLGEGGMGVVYEVVHTDIERRSALKILRFDLSQQPHMAQVFRDEARAASRLGSPNIVEVYDFGELPDGRLFFAMELLEGEDLVPAHDKASMEPGRLIGILRQICKALHRAHEAGVVHRDVKPENIIISKIEGRSDHAKIVDFGISAMLAAGEQRIGIAGTPQYMAPEQILGEDFDGRLDVYALGCTAYELLVGKPPFDAEDVEGLLHKQLYEVPLPVRQARPDLQVPPALEAVVMRCLAKAPANRFADMADLEAALCEAQIAAGIVTPWDDLPIPPLPDDERRQRIIARMPSRDIILPASRGWLWPAVAGVSTLAAAGLAAFLVFGRQPTEAEKDLVEQLTIEARDAASKTAWVVPPPHVDSKITALQKVNELEALEGTAASMADDRAAELRQEFATTLVTYGDQLWDKDVRDFARQYYAWSLMFKMNEDVLARANIELVGFEIYKQRVLAGEFSDADRLMAGVVVLEVEDDPEVKVALNVAVSEGLQTNALSPVAIAALERQATSASEEVRKAVRGAGVAGVSGSDRRRRDDDTGAETPPAAVADPSRANGATPDADPVALDADEPLDGEDPATADARKKRRRQVESGLSSSKKSDFDPARSNELTKQADAKRKQGLRNEAKSLYGQAIAANPSNGEAHLGMALVHFDLGSYHQARKSAEQAVKHAPRNGRAHKTLGDALFKEFRYREAEAAYEEAQRLGVNVGSRLAEVRKQLGGH